MNERGRNNEKGRAVVQAPRGSAVSGRPGRTPGASGGSLERRTGQTALDKRRRRDAEWEKGIERVRQGVDRPMLIIIIIATFRLGI